MFGSVSLTSMPLLPALVKRSGEGAKPEPLLVLYSFPEGCWPACFSRQGLGSKVSTCEGPPFMKRKMTLFARGARWRTEAVMGEAEADASAPRPSSPARPTAPKPPAMRRSMSRREGEAENLKSESSDFRSLVHIHRLVAHQQHLGVLLPARQARRLGLGAAEEFFGGAQLVGVWVAGEEQAERQAHPRRAVG